MSATTKILIAATAVFTAAFALAQGTPPAPASNPAVGSGQRSTQDTPMGATGTPGGGAATGSTSSGATMSGSGSGSATSGSTGSGSGSSMSGTSSGSSTAGGAGTSTRTARADRN
ncbi:MAG: hypothetical protein JWP65_3474 [Ramlibacter sp.]|uniref:hypothetical protein n=1 Tax=Ramlibacter sp. TaxID=1917967 RepID=UPI00261FC622|nr:hypothetical protein [Ramlibacter sp.]MDB5753053.1 hypothetical protein [Ramlibacter sp.]